MQPLTITPSRTSPDIAWDADVLSAPREKANQEVLALWRSLWRGASLPERADLTAHALRAWLPKVFFAAPDGDDFRFRLVGTAIERRMGAKLQGRLLTDVYAAAAEKSLALYRAVASGDAPVTLRGHLDGLGIEFVEFEVTLMPIASDAGVRWVFGVMAETARAR